MYAVIKTGGKQYRVKPGDVLVVEKLAGEPGAKVAFDQVLMIGEGDAVTVGAPLIADALVDATLIETRKGEKVKIFKKIRRQGYRRTRGHRQTHSVLRVTGVAGSALELFDNEQVARADAVLLTAGLDHSVHGSDVQSEVYQKRKTPAKRSAGEGGALSGSPRALSRRSPVRGPCPHLS